MPNMNREGPRGLGQMTGRGRGLCDGKQGGDSCGNGRGRRAGGGQGFGRGLGRGAQSVVALSNDEQKKVLEAQLREIENEKTAIETKIKYLN